MDSKTTQPVSGPTGWDGVALLRRGLALVSEWYRKYGEHRPTWLPPVGTTRWQEDVDAFLDGCTSHQEVAPDQWQETGEPPIWGQVEAIGKEWLADAMAGMTSGADTFFDDMPDQVQPPVAPSDEQEVLQQVLEALELGRDFANSDLLSRMESYRDYPHRYASEAQQVREIEEAIASLRTLIDGGNKE